MMARRNLPSRSLVLLLAGALLLAAGLPVCAQGPASGSVESLIPTRSALQIISSDGAGWVGGKAVDSPANFVMEFGGVSGMALKRSFREQVVTVDGAPLGTGITSSLLDELSLALGARSNFQFSRSQTLTRDIAQSLLSGQEVRVLGFSQGFGGGSGIGSLNLQRTETTNRLATGKLQRTLLDVVGFQAGDATGFNLATSIKKQRDMLNPFGLERSEVSTALGAPVAGGSANVSFARTIQTLGATREETRQTDLTTPLRIFGGSGAFEHHIAMQEVNGARATTKTTKLGAPLPFASAAISADVTTWAHNLDSGKTGKQQAWGLNMTPFGRPWSFAYMTMEASVGSKLEAADKLDLSMPFSFLGDDALLERKVDVQGVGGERKGTRSMTVALPLTGLQPNARYDYRYEQTLKPGQDVEKGTATLVLPLERLHEGADFSFTETYQRQNADEVREATSTLRSPLNMLRQGATLEYSLVRRLQGDDLAKSRSAIVAVPVAVFGLPTTSTYRSTRISRATAIEDQDFFNLSSSIGGQTVRLFERLHTEVLPIGGGVLAAEVSGNQQQEVFLRSPTVHLFGPRLTVEADQLRKTVTAGGETGTQDLTTNVRMAASPFDPLKVSANYKVNDVDGKKTEVEQVETQLALGSAVSIGAHLEATAPEDTASTMRRHLSLTTSKPGDAPLDIKAGLTSWSQPDKETDPGRMLQLKLGNPQALGVSAQYSEYDPNKWVRFEEPTIGVALTHGDPGKFAVKLGYEDSQGRPAPLRGLEVAMPALGGALTLGFSENPMQADGKTVRPAKVYDAELNKKRIFGGVNMALSYRYLDFTSETAAEGVEQYMAVQLDGGKEQDGGKIALSYVTGDFVPQPDKKKAPPTSMLDLSYSKLWGDTGRLVLSLRRSTPPVGVEGQQESTEGRLEFNSKF